MVRFQKQYRGFFAIGIYHTKNELNVGTLWRSAAILGASFLFTVGRRYRQQASDTLKTPRHIPLFHYDTIDVMHHHLPHGCRLVGVELDEESVPLVGYEHPEACVYLLGAEDHGLPPDVRDRCHALVQLPGEHCMNVAAAGTVVMYDRFAKSREASDD